MGSNLPGWIELPADLNELLQNDSFHSWFATPTKGGKPRRPPSEVVRRIYQYEDPTNIGVVHRITGLIARDMEIGVFLDEGKSQEGVTEHANGYVIRGQSWLSQGEIRGDIPFNVVHTSYEKRRRPTMGSHDSIAHHPTPFRTTMYNPESWFPAFSRVDPTSKVEEYGNPVDMWVETFPSIAYCDSHHDPLSTLIDEMMWRLEEEKGPVAFAQAIVDSWKCSVSHSYSYWGEDYEDYDDETYNESAEGWDALWLFDSYAPFSGLRSSLRTYVAGLEDTEKTYDKLSNELHGKMVSKLDKAEVSLGVFLGEMKETSRMLANTFRTLTTFAVRTRKGDLRGAFKALGREPPQRGRRVGRKRTAEGIVLETSFGWMPLLSDIYGFYSIMEQLMHLKGRMVHCNTSVATDLAVVSKMRNRRGTTIEDQERLMESVSVLRGGDKPKPKAKPTYMTTLGTIPFHGRPEMGMWFKGSWSVSNPRERLLNDLGLFNPAKIAWNLVPLSFLVDWLVSSDAYLSSFTADVGLRFQDATTTTLTYEPVLVGWADPEIDGDNSAAILRALDEYNEGDDSKVIATFRGNSKCFGNIVTTVREVVETITYERLPSDISLRSNPMNTFKVIASSALSVKVLRDLYDGFRRA